MEKFSFYDFIAFIVPGGTFILLAGWLIYLNIPAGCNVILPDKIFLIIPFLFLAYVAGHIFSTFGIFLETRLYKKYHFVTNYFIQYPNDKFKLNELSKRIFGLDFLLNDALNPKHVDEFYQKVTDYIEVKKTNDKTIILFGQYAFFRNAAAVSLVISIMLIIIFVLTKIELFSSPGKPCYYSLTSLSAFMLFLVCFIYLGRRLKLLISCSYRNFLSMFINQ
jgi:hypothetical protein